MQNMTNQLRTAIDDQLGAAFRRSVDDQIKDISNNMDWFWKGRDRLGIGGIFRVAIKRIGQPVEYVLAPNLVTTEGINHMLNVTLDNDTQIASWYVAPYTGSITPAAGTTGSTFASVTTETSAYDEATRVLYVPTAATAGVLNSTAAPSVFTINGSITMEGCGLLQNSAKQNATVGQICFAVANFSGGSRTLVASDTISVDYSITLSSS